MRINDIIYFSTNLKLEDLDLSDQDSTLKYFQERITDYYLTPINILVGGEMAFAAGALECLLIDAFARYSTKENGVEVRMVDWCQKFLGINATTATSFYKFFRCGLLHEAHIKQFGQFCFDENYISNPIMESQGFIVVNPKYLLQALEQYLIDFINNIKTDHALYKVFIDRLSEDFSDEIKKSKI